LSSCATIAAASCTSNITAHPTTAWVKQQLREAFRFDTAPKYLIRDRDGIYGKDFGAWLKTLGIEEVVAAPRSPWQKPFVERFMSTLRRECLDHVIVLGERHLYRIVSDFLAYYYEARPHQSLDHDSPVSREVEPPDKGRIIAVPMVGGLHHRYMRAA
jgi:putative transposase